MFIFRLCTKCGAKILIDAQIMAKNRNFGPLKIIDHRRDPQKAHLHPKPRIVSVIAFNSVHILCRRGERNCVYVCLFESKKTTKTPLFAHPKYVIRFL